MPIYEYQCRSCGAVSEYLTSLREQEPVTCLTCGSAEVYKIISSAAVLTKTTGRLPGRTCCGKEERCSTPGETCCKS